MPQSFDVVQGHQARMYYLNPVTDQWEPFQGSSGSISIVDSAVAAGGATMVEFTGLDIGADTAAAYSANDQYGTVVTVSSVVATAGDFAEVDTITVYDLEGKGPTIQVEIFGATITATSDNNVYSLSDADAQLRVASCRIAFSDHLSYTNGSVATVSGFGQKFKTTSTDLLLLCKILESATTYTGSASVLLKVNFKRL